MTTDDDDGVNRKDDAPRRASGASPAEEESKVEHDQLDQPHDEVIDVERRAEVEARAPAFMRMRFNWRDRAEQLVIRNAHSAIDQMMVREFTDAYQIIDEIQSIVRIPLTQDGNPLHDERGEIVWERTPNGRIIEDYTRLTRKQIEGFLGQITVRLFAWEQTAERMWMDALMAKAQFEERYAISYDARTGSATRTTVDDRKASGSIGAAEERYHAVYLTALSRRAQALTRSMERVGQRLKDVLLSG